MTNEQLNNLTDLANQAAASFGPPLMIDGYGNFVDSSGPVPGGTVLKRMTEARDRVLLLANELTSLPRKAATNKGKGDA